VEALLPLPPPPPLPHTLTRSHSYHWQAFGCLRGPMGGARSFLASYPHLFTEAQFGTTVCLASHASYVYNSFVCLRPHLTFFVHFLMSF
jgi:hypothetical protein